MANRTAGQMELLKKAFLKDFAQTGNITESCENVKAGRTTVYRWQEDDAEFLAGFREAEVQATERLESEARRRALSSSDTLLIFLLKGLRPDKYRDKQPDELSTERVLRFVEAVIMSVKQHVGDPGTLAAIGADLDRLNARSGGKSTPVRRLGRG